MDEDFNTAGGIGAIFELVKELNKATEEEKISKNGLEVLEETIDYVRVVMEDVLGVLLKIEVQVGDMTTELIEFLLELRREARDNKDWAFSDKVRDRLLEMGIKIKDGKEKTTWSI